MWSPSAVGLVHALLVLGALAAQAQTLVKWDDGTGLHVYYRTGWATPNIHYATTSGTSALWTATPGVKMTQSADPVQFAKEDGWFRFDLPVPATFLQFAFNDNSGTWDSNGGANYNVRSAGTYALTSAVSTPPSGSCANFDGPDYCTAASQTTYAAADDARIWQSPPRNTTGWTQAAQDYRSLTGYANVVYAQGRKSATVRVSTNLRAASGASCSYSYNGALSLSATFKVDTSLTKDLVVKVTCMSASETWTLELDALNFVWQNNAVTQPAALAGGQKGAIVDLFGWPYADIEAECKDFVGKAGYLGVKISPPQEAVLSDKWPQYGERNPWYFVYQPVSYRLHSRMGTRAQLRSMIQTCRANGVRVYADAVVNHMTGAGNDVSANHRTPSDSMCKKWGALASAEGSPYFTHKSQYELNTFTGTRPTLEFPAVPFAPTDFHCERSIESYTNAFQVQNGWLSDLSDLNTAKPYVRERIAQYFVDLLGVGFSGFRIDAFKHIGPTDAAAILGQLNTAMGDSLPSDFLMWGEVLIGPADADMLACNADSGYNFYKGLDAKYAAAGIATADIAKLKIWSSDYPKNMPICGSWLLPASRFVVQNDDHDQQSPDSITRDMGAYGSVLIKDKDVAKHRSFETQLFSRTDADWHIKVVLSSYTYFANGAAGFPDGLSDCKNGFDASGGQACSKSVSYEKAFRTGSCGYTVEGFAGGKYTRVHRDLAIVNAMRKWLGLGAVTNAQVGITGTC